MTENIDNEVLLVQFCEVLIEFPAYEKLVFEEFLKWFRTRRLNKFLVQFLVKIIWMKTNFLVSENENHKLKFYYDCLK